LALDRRLRIRFPQIAQIHADVITQKNAKQKMDFREKVLSCVEEEKLPVTSCQSPVKYSRRVDEAKLIFGYSIPLRFSA
jgi:hypothetical protein